MSQDFYSKKGDIVVEIMLTKRYRMKQDTCDRFELRIERYEIEHIDDCSPDVRLQGLDFGRHRTTKDKREFGRPVRIDNGWILREYEKRLDDSTIQKLIEEADSNFKREKEKAIAHMKYVDEMLDSIAEHGKALKKQLEVSGELKSQRDVKFIDSEQGVISG